MRSRDTKRRTRVRSARKALETEAKSEMPQGPSRAQDRIRRTSATPSHAKLQRWVDLLASLLARHYPVTLEDLIMDVPAYRRDVAFDARRRMFERDKGELRRLGVPVETVALDDGESVAYRLRTHDFYLPYLLKAGGKAPSRPKRIDRYGYRGLPVLVFEPEELRFVALAAERLRNLKSASLSSAAASALRKLRFDLPISAMHPEEEEVIAPRARCEPRVLDALVHAVLRRKRVRIQYYSIGNNQKGERDVEPYGLFFVSGNWYLAACDIDKHALRTFRASRITNVRTNTRRAGTADFVIPNEFVLREYAESRQAWEVGEGNALDCVVEFRGDGGAIAAAARLGKSVSDAPMRRKFDVRRTDTFARWLLSFGGDAVPISPEVVRIAYDQFAREALANHAAPSLRQHVSTNEPSRRTGAARIETAPRSEHDDQASAQLLRLLAILPILGSEESVDPDGLAHRTGIPVTTLMEDLRALSERCDVPAAFVDAVQVYLEHHRVGVITPHFLRPTRLSGMELLTLELGLAMMRRESSPEDHAWIDRARVRLHGAIAKAVREESDQPTNSPTSFFEADGLGVSTDQDRAHLSLVRRALSERRRLLVSYRGGSTSATLRTLRVYTVVYASGMWYVVGYCEDRKAVRRFRLDRIEKIDVLRSLYDIPKRFALRNEIAGDQVLSPVSKDGDVMRVRYTPRIARWIAEREGRELNTDGSITLEHPVLDPAWAIRYVLQYGGDAEVVAPDSLRELVTRKLDGIIARKEAGPGSRGRRCASHMTQG